MKLKDSCFLEEKLWKYWQHIKKQRHNFANKGPYSQSYGFSSSHVWLWEMDHKEGWEPKNDVFKLWCWRSLLRVPWTARRSNQSILKEISPEYSMEGLMLKGKFQYFGHLMWRTDSLEKALMLGNIEGRRIQISDLIESDFIFSPLTMVKLSNIDDRGWDGWMVSPTQRTWVWASSQRYWRTGKPGVLQSMAP